MGTNKGTVFAVPVSTRLGEPFVLIRDQRRVGAAVRYIRVFNGILFVSWENGWLGVYGVQNLTSQDIDSDILDNFDSDYEYELKINNFNDKKFKKCQK